MFGNDSPNRITNTMGQDGARFLTIRPGKWFGQKITPVSIVALKSWITTLMIFIWTRFHGLPNSQIEAVIVHSRSTSTTFGISIVDGSIFWAINTG
jgi:hypothetical protein